MDLESSGQRVWGRNIAIAGAETAHSADVLIWPDTTSSSTVDVQPCHIAQPDAIRGNGQFTSQRPCRLGARRRYALTQLWPA